MPRLLGFGASWKQDEVGGTESNPDNASPVPASSGTSLLPRPVASFVSLITQSTSLSLRLGTFFGGVALDGARVTTLTGLELTRAMIEGVLTRAGRDVVVQSNGNRGKAEAESILERSLAALHTTVTSASFFAAATFHLSSSTLASASNMSQALLSTLDAILGSTESSRAIAAIITLIRKEFSDQSSHTGFEKVGVGDLLIGTVGFAMLQRWGRKSTERYIHINGGLEIIWDVVILDNGNRADVIETHQIQPAGGPSENMQNQSRRSSFVSPETNDDDFDVVQRPANTMSAEESPSIILPDARHQISDEDIRLYIMQQLPQGCRASIMTDAVTTRTITVNVYDDDIGEIMAPPGTMLVEESFHNDVHDSGSAPTSQHYPKHTIVFRTAFNQSQSADVRPSSRHTIGTHGTSNEQGGHGSRAVMDMVNTTLPIAEPRSTVGSANREAERQRRNPEPTQLSADTHHSGSHRVSPRSAPQSTRRAGGLNSKATFGRSPLTKIVQKVRPPIGEKNDHSSRPSLRSPFENSNSQLSPGNSTQRGKAHKGAATERTLTKLAQAGKSPREVKPERAARPSKTETPTVAANRGAQRTSMQESRTRSGLGAIKPSGRNRTGPPAEYYEVHERNQESIMVQTDSYAMSQESRPSSPATVRTHVRSSSSLSLARSETAQTVTIHPERQPNSSAHRRSKSYSSSIYSLATAGSETSLVLAHRFRRSAYDDASTIQALNRDGLVPGIFPKQHFVRNIRRFCRFSSATYGSNALQVMGVPRAPKGPTKEKIQSQEHSDFSDHIGLPESAILLSSFVDPAGGSNAAGETQSGLPLVHYLFLDHESKAVVLALRGTWGFEDVLTDMTCAYDDLEWQGKSWKVHKGMHASAKHLLMGGGRRVMITIRAALEEFPDYGMILCGHSLGGGVAALLATMISEPTSEASLVSFTTTSHSERPLVLSEERSVDNSRSACYLPPGRPIHVYAYGPPATMSPLLRRATRGLVTTIVNGQDVVPCLSLGILHDMHTTSLAFKSDISQAKSHVRYRVWENLRQSIVNKFYVNETPMLLNAGDRIGEDAWAWSTLKSLRDSMCAPKLAPPGEVFVVETMRVLQRSAFNSNVGDDGYPRLGRPATRVQLKFIRDVETRFGELRFGSGMFSDHNPARYEASLVALARGILDD
ncbi:lipase family protein [Aspergillus lucknowensis]|uniref:sn-1-specific diacylglycerol lipase n=1 Tax=Aspergillus lucknowensis TaxID=176173 RepID=A0ABR4M4G8_9EURO